MEVKKARRNEQSGVLERVEKLGYDDIVMEKHVPD